METSTLLITLGVVAGVAVGGYWVYNALNGGSKPTEETIDGEVKFDDMVAWFKEQHPQRGVSSCVMVTDSNKDFKKLLKTPGYQTVGLVIFEPANKLRKIHILHAKSFDEKTKNAFGNNDLIKLS